VVFIRSLVIELQVFTVTAKDTLAALTTILGFRASNVVENKNRKVTPAIGTVIAWSNRLPPATLVDVAVLYSTG
jgi:hypothetical protein